MLRNRKKGTHGEYQEEFITSLHDACEVILHLQSPEPLKDYDIDNAECGYEIVCSSVEEEARIERHLKSNPLGHGDGVACVCVCVSGVATEHK